VVRIIIFYKNYFLDFFDKQSKKVQEKIDYVLDMISNIERVPKKYFKHLEGTRGLYEIRVKYGNNIYRIFSCFDEGKLVVLFNGFMKKSSKTPAGEIEKALILMNEYFNEKQNLKK
jgi:phage-related protein